MTPIFGVFDLNHQSYSQEYLQAMGHALKFGNSAITKIWNGPAVSLGYCDFQDREQAPALFTHQPSGVTVVADVFLDNRPEILAALSLSDGHDSQLIALAYLQWGSDFLAHLDGDFSFVLWDPNLCTLICARDRFGVRPLVYSFVPGKTLFIASHTAALLAMPEFKPTINEHFVAGILADLWESAEQSPFNEVLRLPPGHSLVIEQGGEPRLSCYWSPQQLPELNLPNDSDYSEKFSKLLLDATLRRTDPRVQVGVELSGGLDSPSVICAAQQAASTIGAKPLHAFSHVLEEKDRGRVKPFLDEQAISEDVCRFLSGITYHPVSTSTKDLCQSIDEFYQLEGVPHVHTYSLHCDILLQCAKEQGVKIMLSGAGGNQAASHTAGNIFTELAHRGDLRTLWQEARLQTDNNKFHLGKLIIRSFLSAHFPRFNCLLHKYFASKSLARIWHLQSQIMQSSFAAQQLIDTRIKSRWDYEPIYRTVASQEALLLAAPIFVSRLEHTWLAGARFGIEYRYPLLDRRLIEFILATPAKQKHKNGIGRYLMRTFLGEHGPEGIAWRTVNKAASLTIPSVYSQLKTSRENLVAQVESMRAVPAITSRINLKLVLDIINKIDDTVEQVNAYEQLMLKKALLIAPFLKEHGTAL